MKVYSRGSTIQLITPLSLGSNDEIILHLLGFRESISQVTQKSYMCVVLVKVLQSLGATVIILGGSLLDPDVRTKKSIILNSVHFMDELKITPIL